MYICIYLKGNSKSVEEWYNQTHVTKITLAAVDK